MKKQIKEYPDYFISNDGKIYSNKYNKEKELKLCPSTNKYLSIVLSKNGKSKRYLVHRLVAQSFIENKLGYSQVNHKDGNVINNNVENLEWVSPKMNMHHAVINNLHKANYGESQGLSKLTDKKVIEARLYYSENNITIRKMAEIYNINHSVLWNAIKGKTWKHLPIIN